jgi:hypothetical protein
MSARFAAMAPFASLKRVGLELDHYSGWTDNWPRLLSEQVIPLRLEGAAAASSREAPEEAPEPAEPPEGPPSMSP